MKIFCSYAFKDEDEKQVRSLMQAVVDALVANGHSAYCLLLDENFDRITDQKIIFKKAFKEIEKCQALLLVKFSERRSEGQLIEVGAALSQGKQLYLLQHSSVKCQSRIASLADKTYSWNKASDLANVLKTI